MKISPKKAFLSVRQSLENHPIDFDSNIITIRGRKRDTLLNTPLYNNKLLPPKWTLPPQCNNLPRLPPPP